MYIVHIFTLLFKTVIFKIENLSLKILSSEKIYTEPGPCVTDGHLILFNNRKNRKYARSERYFLNHEI